MVLHEFREQDLAAGGCAEYALLAPRFPTKRERSKNAARSLLPLSFCAEQFGGGVQF